MDIFRWYLVRLVASPDGLRRVTDPSFQIYGGTYVVVISPNWALARVRTSLLDRAMNAKSYLGHLSLRAFTGSTDPVIALPRLLELWSTAPLRARVIAAALLVDTPAIFTAGVINQLGQLGDPSFDRRQLRPFIGPQDGVSVDESVLVDE